MSSRRPNDGSPRHPRASRMVVMGALGPLLLSTLAGCGEIEARRVLTVSADALCDSVESATGSWQSAPWDPSTEPDCQWLEAPGRTALDIPHPLGRVPHAVLVYLSFEPNGEGAAAAAGDSARVLSVGPERVTIANTTNQQFFARIVLQ